ncbi:unnamed protein product [Coregonus sp. 'balchen']|nr:unnamed protein product [Coregonus sp. 'balchen']
MALRDELLKAIWHAFTSLDVDKSGKVSKSQLKVLSHNLCTVMRIPHDPVALEEHFKHDDEGPNVLDPVRPEEPQQNPPPYLGRRRFQDLIEYFLRKLTEAMGGSWVEERFEDYKLELSIKQQCLSVWELITLVGTGTFSKGMDCQTLSMGITEVFHELILDIFKQGYMMKKGHKRKNWTERWFLLRPNSISYYVSENLAEKKGDIVLNGNCSLGRSAPHCESRQKRRELRQKQQAEQEELELRMRELQTANENKQHQLEAMRKKLEEAAANAAEEERSRLQIQTELQDRYRMDLEREKMVRQEMEEQVAQKSSELEQYLQRVRELEDMYHRLEDALEDEKRARQDEETVRRLQARLLEEEAAKRAELEQIHLHQQRAISETEAEKQELRKERTAQENALQAAMLQLEQLENERQGVLEQYQEVVQKLEDAAKNTRTWKHKVAHHEGLVHLIQPGSKGPQKITNWGPAAFTEAELSLREKDWQERKNRPAQTQ